MSIYRCAVCGSSRVVPETKQEGYNKKQGILGMAVFGLGGAVAGTSGNTVVYYHCADCGHTLNRCMSGVDKELLEKYLLEPTNAVCESGLREYKKQYPNIEWEEPKKEENISAEILMQENQTSLFSTYKNIDVNILVAILGALYEAEKPCTILQMQNSDEFCKKYSEEQLNFVAEWLVSVKVIEKINKNFRVYFRTLVGEKEAKKIIREYHEKELEEIRQKGEIKISEIHNKAKDIKFAQIAILNALYRAERPCTIFEMQSIEASCRQYSNQKLQAVARRLADGNIVEKIIENNKAYFKAIPKSKDEAIKMLGL